MTSASEITPLIAQAWEKDPDENFFEFLFDVFQTNGTLFSLGELDHEQVRSAFERYLEGDNDEPVEDDIEPDAGNP